MAKKNHGSGVGKALTAIGIGAAALGAYMLYGSKESKANREKAKSWMLKLKGEVLEKVEDAREVTQDVFDKIVDEAAIKYEAAKNVDRAELMEIVDELKGHWRSIAGQFAEGEKTARKKKN